MSVPLRLHYLREVPVSHTVLRFVSFVYQNEGESGYGRHCQTGQVVQKDFHHRPLEHEVAVTSDNSNIRTIEPHVLHPVFVVHVEQYTLHYCHVF